MPDYPGAIYSPRTKENKPGVVYDPDQTTKLFAEDVVKDDDEIVAIETELGVNPKGIYDSVAEFLQDLLTSVGTIVTTFLGLSDTPSSYTGQGGKAVFVKIDETGLEFDDAASGLTKATGAEINTGTDDDKYVTPKAIADSNIAFLSDIPASPGGLWGLNVQTLSAGKTLTVGTDYINQRLNPNGADRIITLATAGVATGSIFIIKNTESNTGGYSLQVKQSSTTLDWVFQNNTKEFIFDGTNWQGMSAVTGGVSTIADSVPLGYLAKAVGSAVSIGRGADAATNCVSVGYAAVSVTESTVVGKSAHSASKGVAVGYLAEADTDSVAIGHSADVQNKLMSIALGKYSNNAHDGEVAIKLDNSSSFNRYHYSIRVYNATTAGGTAELFCAGITNSRLTVAASSVMAFHGIISALDRTSGDAAGYEIKGCIKRDGSNNTVLVGTPTVTVLGEDDASWDITITADNTNESLKILATGDASNIVDFTGVIDFIQQKQ